MPPKPLKVQPKINARRSKAEREERERAEAERKRIRAEAAAADARAEDSRRRQQYGLPSDDGRGGFRGRGRGARGAGRGGRGGFMGQRIVTRSQQEMSFGAGSFSRGRSVRGGSGGGVSGHGPSRIKRESGIKRDPDGDIAMLGIKRETDDYGFISSDEDDAGNSLAQNIDDLINLVSEDEVEEAQPGSKASESADRKHKTRGRRPEGLMPIRIQRKEHKDRVVGINTEASSAGAAELRKQAKETTRQGEAGSLDEALTLATKKGKARIKDVEITGGTRKWKGVYDDGNEAVKSPEMKIKQEPNDDADVDMSSLAGPFTTASHTQAAPEFAEAQDEGSEDGEIEPEPEPETKAGVKAKLKQRRRSSNKRAQYQTIEEVREWQQYEDDLVTMASELGRINVSSAETTTSEGSETAQEAAKDDTRTDAVYLFQLPPVMPDLRTPSIVKQEPVQSPTLTNKKPAATTSNAAADASTSTNPPKLEDDPPKDTLSTLLPCASSQKLTLAAGHAGKLRVHKSGRATLTWGGTNMTLTNGINPYFLQTTILTRMARGKEEVGKKEGGYGGEAISFGGIRGKLVVTPDWNEILGS